ncbi:MAG: MoxR family ATPase [Lachnospiraceae bacterium]|nr:MoxR family ATPase [Lachnospiraceae bacterium]
MVKNATIQELTNEITKVIKGKDEVIEKVIMAILASGHILLEDVPGLGKTTLAMAFAGTLGLESKRIQFTPDTMPSDITGNTYYDESTNSFQYMPGAVMCNLLLGDEINRTSAKTQSALLEAMAEGKVTVDGVRHALPDPFIVIATQNPITSSGTQPLPDSQLDRFMIKLSMGYPDEHAQLEMLKNACGNAQTKQVRQIMQADDLIAIRKKVDDIYISDELLQYLIALCEKTRNMEDVVLGISPRGMIAFMKMAKAKAFLDDRDYVIPEDLQAVFIDSCAHRLFLSGRAKRDGVTGEGVLCQIMEQVAKPELLKER